MQTADVGQQFFKIIQAAALAVKKMHSEYVRQGGQEDECWAEVENFEEAISDYMCCECRSKLATHALCTPSGDPFAPFCDDCTSVCNPDYLKKVRYSFVVLLDDDDA